MVAPITARQLSDLQGLARLAIFTRSSDTMALIAEVRRLRRGLARIADTSPYGCCHAPCCSDDPAAGCTYHQALALLGDDAGA